MSATEPTQIGDITQAAAHNLHGTPAATSPPLPQPLPQPQPQRSPDGIRRWLADVGIPAASQGATWDGLAAKTESRETLSLYCSTIGRRVAVGEGVVLIGDVGTGKTCAMALIAQAALDPGGGIETVFTGASALLRKLHRVGTGSMEYQIEQIAEWNCRLLLLDDLGVEYRSPFASSLFHDLMEHRVAHRLATCVTTNLTTDQIRGYSARLYDRLRMCCVFVPLLGTSQRQPVDVASWHTETTGGQQ